MTDDINLDVENFHNRRNDQRWNRVSVGDIIERYTWNEPDKLAIVAGPDATVNPANARVTYARANELINRMANGLLSLGLRPAARVAMLCDNSVEGWLSKVAIAKAGLVAAPINAMMAPDVITDALQRVEAQCAIVDAPLWEKLGDAFRAAGVEPVVMIGGDPDDRIPDYDAFVARCPADEPDVTVHGDDIWEILFTSGTTAAPKAVMISHTYTYMCALDSAITLTRGLDHESDMRLGVFTPMIFHIGDHVCLFPALFVGGTAVLGRVPEGHPMASLCSKERVTTLFGGSPQFVESMVAAVKETPRAYDFSSMKLMFYGWAAMAPGSVKAFRDLCAPDVKLYQMLGQTEIVPCHRFPIERNLDLYHRTAPGRNHVGKPAPIMAATVMDPEGNDLRGRPFEEGEAVYRSPAMFSGYYRDPDATAEALKFGWFHGGDSFAYDAEQEHRIMVDRYKDIVKSGGENVSSIRVEAVLQQHPAVERAAVIGLPDDRWGEAVTACVIAAGGQEIDEAELIAFARERLAGFETPKRIVPMDEFPTTVGGKILKYKLRQELS